jgi:putative transposase
MTAKILTDAQRQKNKAISESLKKTRAIRKSQECRVFDLKITRTSQQQAKTLELMFREYKWIKNEAIAAGVFSYEAGKTVKVRLSDGSFEERKLTALGSQMKQSAVTDLEWAISALATSKEKGRKVGALKFIKNADSIGLKQHKITYEILDSEVKIQKLGRIRVRGTNQLLGYEPASARLVRKADGYHILVSAFRAPLPQVFTPGTAVGIDFGLKTHFTLSDGTEINGVFGEPERLKSLQRKLQRQVKGSNGYSKTRKHIQKEYLKLSYRKDDAANKLVNQLLKNELVVIQDEQLAQWKRRSGFVRGGKKIQAGIFGRTKSRLFRHPRVIVLDRFVATTQTCVCGVKTKHPVWWRVFNCSSCGYSAPRDLHSGQNMLRLAATSKHKSSGQGLPSALVEAVSGWLSSDFLLQSEKLETARISQLQVKLPQN